MKIKSYIRLISLILCVILILPGCSCCNGDTVISAAGIDISKGIYSYYLSTALSDYVNENRKENETLVIDEKKVHKMAEEYCITYALILKEFNDLSLTLGYGEKSQIANKSATDWVLYRDYYKAIGVSKVDYTKILEFEQCKNAVFMKYYDIGGRFEVSEEDVRTSFSENFILFKTIVGYKTETDENGAVVRLDDQRSSELIKQFQTMAGKIIDKKLTFEQAKYQYNSPTPVSDDVASATTVSRVEQPSIIGKDSKSYPRSFFNQVVSLEYNVPTVLEFEDYVYLVLRLNILEDETVKAQDYREACLKALKYEDFIKLISDKLSDISLHKNESKMNSVKLGKIIELGNYDA